MSSSPFLRRPSARHGAGDLPGRFPGHSREPIVVPLFSDPCCGRNAASVSLSLLVVGAFQYCSISVCVVRIERDEARSSYSGPCQMDGPTQNQGRKRRRREREDLQRRKQQQEKRRAQCYHQTRLSLSSLYSLSSLSLLLLLNASETMSERLCLLNVDVLHVDEREKKIEGEALFCCSKVVQQRTRERSDADVRPSSTSWRS